MSVKWTSEQQKVIDLRNRNILVSAAAGSGKTAVLVERIISRLTQDDPPLDVDHLLIVTYTEAAAAEMKERIGAAVEKLLEAHPGDAHLERQATLIYQRADHDDPQLLSVGHPGPFPCDRDRSGIPDRGRRRTEASQTGCDG